MKYSIIVPVYKTQIHLNACVESILNQTHTDLELILVDDGSPDDCPILCDIWAKKDSRVKVVHQINQGVSAARNAGIAVATGDYIGFVDSDDTVLPNWLFCVEDKNKEYYADIISFGIFDICQQTVLRQNVMVDFYAPSKLDFLNYFNEFNEKIIGSVCLKLYKTIMLHEHKIFFNQDITITEDLLFDYAAYPIANNYLNLGQAFYEYRQNVLSSTNKGRKDILSTYFMRLPHEQAFLTGMGLPLFTDQEQTIKLADAVYKQYLQAVITSTSFTLCDKLEILSNLYEKPLYRSMLLEHLHNEHFFHKLIGNASIRLRCPILVALPSVITKSLRSLFKGVHHATI